MKIIVENKIPYIREAIEQVTSDVVYLPAAEFTRDSVKDADVLIIRTRVKCDKNLLEGSSVKFIATATIGFDHIDTAYCDKAGIIWKNAPGCNSNSVKQYVEAAIILCALHYNLQLSSLTLGVIGVGHVGEKIVELGKSFGMRVLQNDPLRAVNEENFTSVSISTIAEQADIITFHVPLSTSGYHATYHLANSNFFNQLTKKPILINTSRGEVVDTMALTRALDKGLIRNVVIDVWENEPCIDKNLLSRAFITTPHIAGYSADGKCLAAQMSLQAISDFYNLKLDIKILPPSLVDNRLMSINASNYNEAVLKIYNPLIDSELLKENPDQFESFRGNYYLRREPSAFNIIIE